MSDIRVYLALSQLFFIRWSEFDSGSGYNLVVLGAWEVRSREKGPNENGRPKAKGDFGRFHLYLSELAFSNQFIRWSEFDSGSGYNLVALGAWEVRSREKGPNENGRPKAKATSGGFICNSPGWLSVTSSQYC